MATVLRYEPCRPEDEGCVCEWVVPERRNISSWCSAPATVHAVWDDDHSYHTGTARNFLCDVHYREWEQGAGMSMAAYQPVLSRIGWVCEHNPEHDRNESRTWCREPAVWEARLTENATSGRQPCFLCDAHHRELEGEQEVRTRTTPAASTVTWESCSTREGFHCEHPGCIVMRRRGEPEIWRATWRRHPMDSTYTTPNFLCDAHYQALVEAPRAEEAARVAASAPTASSFDRLVALTLGEAPQDGQTLRFALTSYLRMTNPQLSRFRGLWHEVASALVIRHLRRKGLLDDLAVAHDVRVGNALAKAAIAPRRRTA